MIAMRMMQPSVHDVIDMVAVRYGFVTATEAMRVGAADLGRAPDGIRGIYSDGMLVDMVLVRMVKMAVMKIIDMAVVPDCRVPTAWAVSMGMVGMLGLGASRHDSPPCL